jgi:TetR/AcrR family transcriptional regulator
VEGVKARLLASALFLFAERGYSGVAVDEIVKRAGVNKRMVYHYFGSKEGIYGEVLRTVFEQLETIELALFSGREAVQDPEEAMQDTVYAYFSFLQKNPNFVRLLLWENLNEGRHLGMLQRPVTKSHMLAHLTRLLETGEIEGRFREGLDPRSVLVSLIGLCLIYFSNRHTLATTLGLNMCDEKYLRGAARHSCSILLHGISKPQGPDLGH